jgi:hypothetical protein
LSERGNEGGHSFLGALGHWVPFYGGMAGLDPYSVVEKCRDEARVDQCIETGFQGQGTGIVATANEYYHRR